MLPLLLQHGRTFDLPIVMPNCRQVVLRDLIYRNKGEDLITQCRVSINGVEVTYNRSHEHEKTYYVNGQKDAEHIIDVEPQQDLRISLEISCHDFSLCHCRDHRFHLNMLAICE